jgi:hypothetical protein
MNCPQCGKDDRVVECPLLISDMLDPSAGPSCVGGGICQRCGIWFLPWGEFGDLDLEGEEDEDFGK